MGWPRARESSLHTTAQPRSRLRAACSQGTRSVVPGSTPKAHKTRDDGDRGPNTGGMGAYSPAPVVTPAVHDRIMREIMRPTVEGLAAEGIEYRGFLYAGLMIDAAGRAKVLEFNCRGGDPETQPILCSLRSDLVDLCLALFQNRLPGTADGGGWRAGRRAR